MRKKIYTYIYLRFTPVFVEYDTFKHGFQSRSCLSLCTSSCSSAVWFCLWKRQCFMAIEGRSHMCISCCTNIVQCSAWNKARVEANMAGSSFHERLIAGFSSISIIQISLSHKHRPECLWIKQKKREEMPPFCSRLEKRFESKPSWGLRKRNPNLLMEIFPSLLLFPAVTFGNVRTVRASKASSYSAFSGTSRKSVGGRVEAFAAIFTDRSRAGPVFCTQPLLCLKQVSNMGHQRRKKCKKKGRWRSWRLWQNKIFKKNNNKKEWTELDLNWQNPASVSAKRIFCNVSAL